MREAILATAAGENLTVIDQPNDPQAPGASLRYTVRVGIHRVREEAIRQMIVLDSSANRRGNNVGERAFGAVSSNGHHGEVPGSGLQIVEDVGLETYGIDLHRAAKLLGARAVVDSVAG